MQPVISIENLGKKYTVRHNSVARYRTLREAILRTPQKLLSKQRDTEEFWACKNLDLEVNTGDRIGIIGKNGAGKSTLLKLISRITLPSLGSIILRGRVSSLLEVGTGFHPELTGRENIFLNGGILGMRRSEVQRKFDAIVDFAGVEKFLDTPVKRYSSGMYIRLAFAVAAHLESEILVIDEVLAVGDIEFQKKCLGKMNDIANAEGRTILFVSHNMGSIKKLCKTGILLDKGCKVAEGAIDHIAEQYYNTYASKINFEPIFIREIGAKINKFSINEEENGRIIPYKPLKITVEIEAQQETENIGIQFMISHDDTDGVVFASNTKHTKNINVRIKNGLNTFTCLIHKFNLCSGKYRLGFGIDIPFVKFYFHDIAVLSFEVGEILLENTQLSTNSAYGHVYLDHDWEIQ